MATRLFRLPRSRFTTALRRGERRDSVDEAILRDRLVFGERIASLEGADEAVLTSIRNGGLGRFKRYADQKAVTARLRARGEHANARALGVLSRGSAGYGKGGYNVDGLPEIALTGHSNAGKSALVNALVGLRAKAGIAAVDPRAGWTDAIHLFKATVSGTSLVLVDTPGYGLAVVPKSTSSGWERDIRSYLRTSPHLRAVFLLVDCTRGLCDLDMKFVDHLDGMGVTCQVVLTKVDLLSQEDLARSLSLTREDLSQRGTRYPRPAMVSAHMHQGIRDVWGLCRHYARCNERRGEEPKSRPRQ